MLYLVFCGIMELPEEKLWGSFFCKLAVLGLIIIGSVIPGCSTPNSSFLQGSVKPVMVNIDSGMYTSSGFDIHQGEYVKISMFCMGQYEVTQRQYEWVMGENPSYHRADMNPSAYFIPGEIPGLRPVEQVTWLDAVSYCNKLSILEGLTPCYSVEGITDPDEWENLECFKKLKLQVDRCELVSCNWKADGYRLPTETEWLYAARAGEDYRYSGSDNIEEVGWYSLNSRYKTQQVGLKKPNKWGLYDMTGNVAEWCWDWYHAGLFPSGLDNPKCSERGHQGTGQEGVAHLMKVEGKEWKSHII